MHADLREVAGWLAATGGDLDDAELDDALYLWYLNRTPLPEPDGPLRPFECSLPGALRAAHARASRFEGGWTVEAVSTLGRVVARRGALSRVLEPGEVLAARKPGARIGPGDPVLVSGVWDWIDEAGFWHTRRGEWPPPGADRLVRIYWNCAPAVAPELLGRLTGILEAPPGADYVIKSAAHPDHGGRADALVLYLGPEGFRSVEPDLRRLARDRALGLRPARTRMTAPLGPGVGLAEGPVAGDSFGKLRCGLLRRAFRAVPVAKRRDTAAVQTALGERFESHGLDPTRPYLEPGAERDYV